MQDPSPKPRSRFRNQLRHCETIRFKYRGCSQSIAHRGRLHVIGLSWEHALKWLATEGVLPLFGAGIAYLLWGVVLYAAANPRPAFKSYAWKEAVDPFGWLYGGAILASQLLGKTWAAGPLIVTVFLVLELGACALFLFAAMTHRGQNAKWQPPSFLTWAAAFLVIAIIIEGFFVYHRGGLEPKY